MFCFNTLELTFGYGSIYFSQLFAVIRYRLGFIRLLGIR
jgi:hypothetical protein